MTITRSYLNTPYAAQDARDRALGMTGSTRTDAIDRAAYLATANVEAQQGNRMRMGLDEYGNKVSPEKLAYWRSMGFV
jgi:hypothetical protein